MINFLAEWDISSNWFNDWFYNYEFFFGIAKYAVCILTGIILAYFICTKEGERMGINKDDVLICATVIVPLCIVGARIWYMAGDGDPTFKYYVGEYGFFKAVLYIIGYTIGFDPEFGSYEGISGLAIHGGIAVAIIAVVIVSKIKKWNIFSVSDMVAPGLLIGQICGRWGNFFNQEAHGIVVGGWKLEGTSLVANLSTQEQWERLTKTFHVPKFISKFMYMDGERYYYGIVDGEQTYAKLNGYNFFHPTFLYESLLNLLGLLIYFVLRRRKFTKSGTFIGFYLIWYGIVRFFIEKVRTDSLYLPGSTLKMAQVTSIAMIIIGIIYLIYIYFIRKNDKYMDIIEKNKAQKEELSKEEKDEEVVIVK